MEGSWALRSPRSALAWSPEGRGGGPLPRSPFTPGMKSEQCAVPSLPWSQRHSRLLPPPCTRVHTRRPRSREPRGGRGLEVFHDMHQWRWTAPAHPAEVETVETDSATE